MGDDGRVHETIILLVQYAPVVVALSRVNSNPQGSRRKLGRLKGSCASVKVGVCDFGSRQWCLYFLPFDEAVSALRGFRAVGVLITALRRNVTVT